MKKEKKLGSITFPQMGDYAIPANFLLSHILHNKIIVPKKITSRTIELGTKYSPEFVCTPFKYTLGTLLEGLENGANILIQAGGGCRYGYYAELQEQILKDLGYDFKFYNLVVAGHTDVKRIYHMMKEIDSKFHVLKGIYYLLITKQMIKYMDDIDHYIRGNIGFEVEKGSFLKLKEEMLKNFSKVNNPLKLHYLYRKYKKKFKEIKINKPNDVLKIGIIGELYTVMEPYSNYELEKELASMHIEVKRFTNVYYLLFEKHKKIKQYLKNTKKYITYQMGADAADNIGRAKELCLDRYDGIIHIKSSFCTPEISAMPIISKVCNDYHVPVIFFSFDSNTSEVGIKTRLEAFYDMLLMRRKL